DVRHLAPVEDPDRLVEQAPERRERHAALVFIDQARCLARPALHERQVDVLLVVAQQAQVVARAQGGAQLHLDAVALQLGLVALAEGRVRALLGALGSQLSPGSRVNVNASEYSSPLFWKSPIRARVTPNWLSVSRCGSPGS